MTRHITYLALATALGLLSGCPCGTTADFYCDPLTIGSDGTSSAVPFLTPDGIPSIVPVGTRSLPLSGGHFQAFKDSLRAELRAGTTTIPATLTVVDDSHLAVMPTWPAGLPAGPATLTLRTSRHSLPDKQLTLIRFGFRSGGTGSKAPLPASSPGRFKKPRSMTLEPASGTSGTSRLLVFDPPNVLVTPYEQTKGTLGAMSMIGFSNGTQLAAAWDFDADHRIDFAIADDLAPAKLEIGQAYYGYQQALAGVLQAPWKPLGLSTLAGGVYDSARTMIVAGNTSVGLYSCLVLVKNANFGLDSNGCTSVGQLAATARSLWVEHFAAGLKGDILALDARGGLSLWRSGAGEQFTDQSASTLGGAIADKQLLAVGVADLDGLMGDDIVAVSRQEVVMLLNNGQGSFEMTATAFSALPAARSIFLGDVDGDGRADLVLIEAETGTPWALLHQTDGKGALSWGLPGPLLDDATGQALSAGSDGVALLDKLPGSMQRHLLIAQSGSAELVEWQSATTP